MFVNPLDLTGRRVLVTGASSGIGREISILLSQLGASVVVAGRDSVRLENTIRLLAPGSHSVEIFDLSAAPDAIPLWIRRITEGAGELHGLVHSAGKQVTSPLRFVSAASVEDVIRTNVTSAVMLARGFMQKGCYCSGGGSIVLVSSIMGTVSRPAITAYSASKAALFGLCRSLALETAKQRIRVNCIAPGFVETEMLSRHKDAVSPEQFEALRDAHPLGFGTPEDVASAAAFLLADTGRWITGSILVADGGYSIQ